MGCTIKSIIQQNHLKINTLMSITTSFHEYIISNRREKHQFPSKIPQLEFQKPSIFNCKFIYGSNQPLRALFQSKLHQITHEWTHFQVYIEIRSQIEEKSPISKRLNLHICIQPLISLAIFLIIKSLVVRQWKHHINIWIYKKIIWIMFLPTKLDRTLIGHPRAEATDPQHRCS